MAKYSKHQHKYIGLLDMPGIKKQMITHIKYLKTTNFTHKFKSNHINE